MVPSTLMDLSYRNNLLLLKTNRKQDIQKGYKNTCPQLTTNNKTHIKIYVTSYNILKMSFLKRGYISQNLPLKEWKENIYIYFKRFVSHHG